MLHETLIHGVSFIPGSYLPTGNRRAIDQQIPYKKASERQGRPRLCAVCAPVILLLHARSTAFRHRGRNTRAERGPREIPNRGQQGNSIVPRHHQRLTKEVLPFFLPSLFLPRHSQDPNHAAPRTSAASLRRSQRNEKHRAIEILY